MEEFNMFGLGFLAASLLWALSRALDLYCEYLRKKIDAMKEFKQ